MATKTVVCPDCGAEAAPGRYACSACGALLAAVGAPVRRWDPSWVVDGAASDEPSAGDAPLDEPVEIDSHDGGPELAADTEVVDDEAADGSPDVAAAAIADPVEAGEPAEPAAIAAPPPIAPVVLTPAPVAAAASVAAASTVPVWPPAGDAGPIARPSPRTPAGAYLSPSAVLPPVEPPRPAAPVHEHPAPEAATRRLPSVSLADTLGTLGIGDDVSRHLIAAGGAIAGLGFLLPWASVIAGNGLGGAYWSRWGLAGPGHWLIVLGLMAIVGLAIASGRDSRLARVPIGPLAVVAAAILIGLLWPYLFGVFERFVGVWLVLAGTLVLGIGGLLGLRRHDPVEPSV